MESIKEFEPKLKAYLRNYHDDKLKQMILEGTMKGYVNRWSHTYNKYACDFTCFSQSDQINMPNEELLVFNKDLSVSRIFDLIDNDLCLAS